MGHGEYGLLLPGMSNCLRGISEPAYFEKHAESIELWLSGNALFIQPDFVTWTDEPETNNTLKDILAS